MTRSRIRTALVAAVLALLLVACGDDTDSSTDAGVGADPDPGSGAEPGVGVIDPDEPVEGRPDDTGTVPDDWEDFPVEQARETAQAVLGMFEADLDGDVRIARRGDEHFMLTEDYVLGRLTVDLDDDGHGYRVVSVTVELPDGPETYELDPG